MVNLGSIYWTVQVANAANAADQAAQVQDQMGKTAEKANKANQAVNRTSRGMGKYNKNTGKARATTSRFSGTLGLLSSALFFVITSLAKLMGISVSITGTWATLTAAGSTLYGWLVALGGYIPSLSAVWATVTGAVKGFVSWLAAGSAGAMAAAVAIGALIGLLGVGILEWLGILDAVRSFASYLGNTLPSLASDALLALISIFAGPLAVIGGFINGFVQGVMQGDFIGGIKQGISQAKEVLNVFAGAWGRILDRITGAASDAWDAIKKGAKNTLGGLGDAIGGWAKSGWNAVVPSTLSLPSHTLSAPDWAGGYSYTIGGQSLDLPQLNTGGFINEGGLAELHAGETVVPADVTRNIFGGGGGGGGGAAGGVTIENVSIEIGDQSLDIRSMTPSEVRRLAEAIAPELGREVQNIVQP